MRRHVILIGVLAVVLLGCEAATTPSGTTLPASAGPAGSPAASSGTPASTIEERADAVTLLTREPPLGSACRDDSGIGGMLVADPEVGTKLIAPPMNDEQPHELIAWWPRGYTGQRVGNAVEVHAPDGRLVAVTGKEVFLPGELLVPEAGKDWSGYWGEMPAGTAFWHCGDTSPPLPVYAPPSPALPDGPFELAHSQEPADGRNGACSLGWWMAGRLIVDPNGGTAIVVEGGDYGTVGDTSQVWWWPKFTGHSVGNEVSVLDPDGKVVATTGKRYRISLAYPPGGPPYVVCGDDVSPLP